jgi:hypothetical protein
MQQGFKSQQLTLIRDLILFAELKFMFLHAISLKVYTHAIYFSNILKNWFFFGFFLLLPSNPQVFPNKRNEGQNTAWQIGIAYINLTPWRQVIQSTILSCSSPAPYEISILGHSKPAHTSSLGRMMDAKLLGNSFLWASGSLANHSG